MGKALRRGSTPNTGNLMIRAVFSLPGFACGGTLIFRLSGCSYRCLMGCNRGYIGIMEKKMQTTKGI